MKEIYARIELRRNVCDQSEGKERGRKMTVQGVARRDVDVAGACTEEEGPDYAQRTRTRGDAAGTGALDLCTDWGAATAMSRRDK